MDVLHDLEGPSMAIDADNDSFMHGISYALTNRFEISVCFILPYTLFVLWLGPAMMKNRSPFHLNILMFIYDMCLVLLNLYLGLCVLLFNNKYTTYLYGSKFIDLLDTVFFILTKKQSHVSFLHVSHHIATPLIIWYIGKTDPYGRYWTFPLMLNCFIHVFMYSYYGFVTIGCKFLSNYKKYMTRAQIIQFIIQMTYLLFLYSHGCTRGIFCMVLGVMLPFALLLLFINFYLQNYVKNKQQ